MTPRAKRILVVDDEPHVVYVTRYKLETAGYEVLVASNGEDGLKTACAELPDAVVTDFQMPGGDGFEMALRLRTNASTADIPVIMLTARTHKLKPSELGRTSIRHLMEKPFSPTELLEKLTELLCGHGQNDAGDRAA